jgi:methylated-DNA-[protein]-cysteine S-methyltransferase
MSTSPPEAHAGDLFAALPEVDEAAERRLHARLIAAANAAGNPKAVRAVGTACATNPLPIVVPCHRVVRSDGTIGQHAGGTEAKKALLALEAAR